MGMNEAVMESFRIVMDTLVGIFGSPIVFALMSGFVIGLVLDRLGMNKLTNMIFVIFYIFVVVVVYNTTAPTVLTIANIILVMGVSIMLYRLFRGG